MWLYKDDTSYEGFNHIYFYNFGQKGGWKPTPITEINLEVNPVDYCTSYLVYPYCVNKESSNSSKQNAGAVAYFYPIDIDDLALEKAHIKAEAVISSLWKDYQIEPDYLDVYFSGSKGYHIEIPAVLFGGFPPDDWGTKFKQINKELNLPYIDDSIYSKRQMWRHPNTINSKSGLYKVQLTHRQFCMGSDYHKKYAEKTQDLVKINTSNIKPNKKLKAIRDMVALNKPETAVKPLKMSSYRQNKFNELVHTGVQEGNRNNTFYKIGKECKKMGKTKPEAIKIGIAQNELNIPPETNTKEMTASLISGFNAKIIGGKLSQFLREDIDYIALTLKQRAIYLDLILHATIEPQIVYGIKVGVNQALTGKRGLAKRAKVAEDTVFSILKALEKKDLIEMHSEKRKYTLVTLLKVNKLSLI